jgi:hypothetical protein
MTALLPTPTIQLVRAASDEFNRDFAVPESALRQLLEQFPHNTDSSHVLLKVVALNRLYATNIFDVWTVASHITELGIDQRLIDGSPGLVDLIGKVTIGGKIRNNYSFATKYCSWHNPAAYPIYDRNVDLCLWAYRKQDRFFSFAHDDLWRYETFLKAINDFRNHYELASVGFKQIDAFLWAQGKAILDNKAAEKVRVGSTAV